MKTMEKVVYVYMRMESAEHENLMRILNHHIDYLIDVEDDSLVCSIYGVESFVADEKEEKRKLWLLKNVIDDLLELEPSDEEIENDQELMDCYADMHNLRESLQDVLERRN